VHHQALEGYFYGRTCSRSSIAEALIALLGAVYQLHILENIFKT
jgi:hypothetical protein